MRLTCALAFAILTFLSVAAQAERRIALVIGNDRYENLSPLTKAVADARSYADVLEAKGFDKVFLRTDLNRSQMDEAIAAFIEQIQPGDVAVFAYSGHGWSDGRENYLIGTEAPETGSPEYMMRISIPLRNGRNGVIDDMARRGADLKIAIIDACRTNPFKPQPGMKSVGQSRGLAEINPGVGEFVIFAADTGQISLDRLTNDDASPNSVFTRVFAPLLETEESLLDAIKKTQRQVMELARTVSIDQRPAYFDGVVGDPCLSGDCGDVPAAAQAKADEVVFWETIAGSSDPADFEAYLDAFPEGVFTRLAHNRLAVMRPEQGDVHKPIDETVVHQIDIPAGLTSAQIFGCITADQSPVGERIPGLTPRQEARCREAGDLLAGPVPSMPGEGSLLPGSYAFEPGDTRASLVETMLSEHTAAVDEIWAARDPDLPLSSPEELVTLASIVEKETAFLEEVPRIAAVFLNRLRLNMRLQSDPTVVYGIFGGTGKPVDYAITVEDRDRSTPYNTYSVEGLPPGPISNPSRAVLEAVAHPPATRDLFFVADGSGRHAFAETYEEHLRNVARWRDLSGVSTVAKTVQSQKAILYEEPVEGAGADAEVTAVDAEVTWRYVGDGPDGPRVEADFDVPGRNMTIKVSLYKNADEALPASHLVEVVVDTPADFPGKSIGSVPRIVLKPTEGARGEPLVGAAVKVADGFFWVALSAAESDIASNLSLMRERNWIDLPFVYEDGRRAILTFQKGPEGEAAFQRAFAAWNAG